MQAQHRVRSRVHTPNTPIVAEARRYECNTYTQSQEPWQIISIAWSIPISAIYSETLTLTCTDVHIHLDSKRSYCLFIDVTGDTKMCAPRSSWSFILSLMNISKQRAVSMHASMHPCMFDVWQTSHILQLDTSRAIARDNHNLLMEDLKAPPQPSGVVTPHFTPELHGIPFQHDMKTYENCS